MGWAKYYEDNLSIMNNRLPFTYAEKEEPLYQVRPSIHEAVKVAPSRKRDRAELKIHFTGGDNRIAARKLQINGWWWSKLNNRNASRKKTLLGKTMMTNSSTMTARRSVPGILHHDALIDVIFHRRRKELHRFHYD